MGTYSNLFFEAVPITTDRTVSPDMSSPPTTSDFVVILLVVFSMLEFVVWLSGFSREGCSYPLNLLKPSLITRWSSSMFF